MLFIQNCKYKQIPQKKLYLGWNWNTKTLSFLKCVFENALWFIKSFKLFVFSTFNISITFSLDGQIILHGFLTPICIKYIDKLVFVVVAT